MTDSELIEWLEEMTKNSSTGLSLEYVRGQGFRVMSRGKIDEFQTSFRNAIERAVLLRQPPPPSPRKK